MNISRRIIFYPVTPYGYSPAQQTVRRLLSSAPEPAHNNNQRQNIPLAVSRARGAAA